MKIVTKFYIYLVFISLINSMSLALDLTRQDAIVKTVLLKGEEGDSHFYDPANLTFDTGKLYKLIIKNESNSKHYFSSNLFAKAIFTRKVQVTFQKKKIAEIKGIINEVEVWPGQHLEWWFVPIKTGVFKDLECKVFDENTKLYHSDMGMKGIITIN